MSATLAQRIHVLVRQVLDGYPGSWLVWCDPHGHWAPLLERVVADGKLGGFSLLVSAEETGGEAGSPLLRRQLQERLDAHERLVLLVRAASDDLGWLWAQSLRAERIYTRHLREQLLDWGWRPQSLTMADDELAALAHQSLAQDPQDWGGGGLQPDLALLVRVLSGLAEPDEQSRLVLDATIEASGLPPLDLDNLSRWHMRTLARLLVTQAHHAAPESVGEGHELLIPLGRRGMALDLLAYWADSVSLRGRLANAVVDADKMAALGGVTRMPLVGNAPFLSRAAEAAAFRAMCREFARLEGKDILEALAARHDGLMRHAEGFWGEDWPGLPALPWREAARLATAAGAVLEATPGGDWSAPQQAVAWYQSGGWRLDRAGEELMRTLSHPDPDLIALIAPLREAYRNRWEDLLIRWSAVWAAAGCPVVALPSTGEWLKEVLAAKAKAPTAVIVVDALRYDLGATLVERLNTQEGAQRAHVAPARAPLPSVTALGMGMALPLPEKTLEADLASGAWRLRQHGKLANLSDAAERRDWWQEHGGVSPDALRALASLVEGEIPAPAAAKRTRLVIHDDALDQLGHDDQLEALGSEPVLTRYLTVIGRLRDAGWRRILMVTDHGYIHWDGAAERQVPPPVAGALYANRRALAYPAETTLPAPQALAPGGQYRIAFPSGAACFKTYGGLGYFHGGASLQEWIIPCVAIAWPAAAAPVGVEILPLAKILSLKVRVTLQVSRPGLFPEDALPRRVTIVIRDATTSAFLFRSGEVSVTPDLDTMNVTLDPTAEPAARGTEVRIEVRDATNDEVIARGDSVLMVEKDDWADTPNDW